MTSSTNDKTHWFMKGKKPFKWSICDASFERSDKFNCHVVTVREGTKPFKWNACDLTFTTYQSMARHIDSWIENFSNEVFISKLWRKWQIEFSCSINSWKKHLPNSMLVILLLLNKRQLQDTLIHGNSTWT